MSNAANEVDIIIRTQAELDGLTKTREQLSALGKQAVEGSNEAKMFSASIDSLDKVIKGGVGGSIPETAHHLEIFGLKGHEAHLAIRLLSGTIGEFGHVLHFASLGPALAGIAALVIGIKAAKEAIEEYNKKLDEQAQEAAQRHTAVPDAIKKAWEDASVARGKYMADLAVAGAESDPTTAMIARVKQLDAALLEAHKKQITMAGETSQEDIKREGLAHGDTQQKINDALEADKLRTQKLLDALESPKSLNELLKEKKTADEKAPALQKAREDAVAYADKMDVDYAKNQAEFAEAKKSIEQGGEYGPEKGQALTDAVDAASKKARRKAEWLNATGPGIDVEAHVASDPAFKAAQARAEDFIKNTNLAFEKMAKLAGHAAPENGAGPEFVAEAEGSLKTKAEEAAKNKESADKAAANAKAEETENEKRRGDEQAQKIAQARALKEIQDKADSDAQSHAAEMAKKKADDEWKELVKRVNTGGGTPEEQAVVARAKAHQDTAALRGEPARIIAEDAVAKGIRLTTPAVHGADEIDTATGKPTVASQLAPPLYGGIDTAGLSKAAAAARNTADKARVLAEAKKDQATILDALSTTDALIEGHSASIGYLHNRLVEVEGKLRAQKRVVDSVLQRVQNVSTNATQ